MKLTKSGEIETSEFLSDLKFVIHRLTDVDAIQQKEIRDLEKSNRILRRTGKEIESLLKEAKTEIEGEYVEKKLRKDGN